VLEGGSTQRPGGLPRPSVWEKFQAAFEIPGIEVWPGGARHRMSAGGRLAHIRPVIQGGESPKRTCASALWKRLSLGPANEEVVARW